jgi:hypothetical protein
MHFTKLFSSILDSTLWQQPKETKIVWITMLAMSDRRGDVFASIPGLAVRAGVTLGECEDALKCLLSPDKYSRTKDFEGRRICEIDGGWNLLNYGKHRSLLSAEERREYNRMKQSEYRANRRQGVNKTSNCQQDVNDMSMTVNDNAQCQHIAEAEAEAEANKLQATTTPLPDAGIPTLKEVTTYGEMHGVKPEVAEKFYRYTEGNQLWLNRHGRMINWKQKLVDWQVRERTASPQAPEKVNGTPRPASSVYAMKQRLDATESLIRDIRNRGTDHPLGWEAASPEDSKELKRLRTLKKQLTAELSKGTV